MTDEKPPEHPAATVGFWRYWRFELVGCLSFFSSLTLCLFLTVVVADVATQHISRTEVSDSLYHVGVFARNGAAEGRPSQSQFQRSSHARASAGCANH